MAQLLGIATFDEIILFNLALPLMSFHFAASLYSSYFSLFVGTHRDGANKAYSYCWQNFARLAVHHVVRHRGLINAYGAYMSSVVSRSFPSFSAPSYVTGAQQKLGSRRTLFSQTDAMSIANKAPRALYGARLYGKPSALTLASPDSAFLHNRVRDVARKETVQASPKRPASQTPQARLVGPSVFDPLKFNFVHHDCQTNALDGKLRKFVVSHDDKTSVITVDVAPNLHSLGQKIKHPDAVIGGWITQNDQIHALFMRVRLEWGWHQFLFTPLLFNQLRA